MASDCGSTSTTTPGPGSPSPEPLITPQEEVVLSHIRRRFTRELAKRHAEGRDYPCFFGQFALARVLRGNDGDLDAAVAWLHDFLAKAKGWNLDALVSEMTAKLDASPNGVPADTMLPYAREVAIYIRAIFTAPDPTPDGGPVNYIPLARFNKRAIYSNMEWSHFVRYMHGATVLRVIECDRLSVASNRAVQVVTVIDLAGCGITDLVCPKFDLAYSRDISSFQTQVAAEIFGPVYILNTPRFVMDLYWVLFRLLPERFRRKIHLVQGTGLEDPDFVHLVGGEGQLRRMLAFRSEMSTEAVAAPASRSEESIARRRSFSYSVDVLPGQRIRWSFEVLRAPGDALLGDSDLSFSVRGLWTAKPDEADKPSPPGAEERHRSLIELLRRARPEGLVNKRRVPASKGKVTGSHLVTSPGVVTLTWSNGHSLARGKVVRYTVQISEGANGEDTLQLPGITRIKEPQPGDEPNGMWCCVGRSPVR